MAKSGDTKMLKVTLRKSGIGYNEKQKSTLIGLGIKKMHRPSILKDTPEVRGMINKVTHLVEVEEIK